MLEIALPALDIGEVLQRRAPRRDGVGQDIPHLGRQPLQPGPADLARRRQRRDAGAVQGLAHIDIAQPRHIPLVQQRDLDVLRLAGKGLGQMGGGEAVAQRLRPQTRKPGVPLDRFRRDQPHEAEPPRVGIAQPRQHPAPIRRQTHMLVLARHRRIRLEHARRHALQGEPPRHAQMGHPGLAGRQREQQILGPPIQPQHRRPVQPLHEPLGKGKAQVRPVLTRRRQPRPLQHRLQTTPHGFDFG
ncbi:hypothetical protein D3C80_1331810 [compost metagenome]